MNHGFKLAICQMKVEESKTENTARAMHMVTTASNNGPGSLSFPKCSTAPTATTNSGTMWRHRKVVKPSMPWIHYKGLYDDGSL